jgi:mannose-1-phosphate guanylyltransferase
VLRVPPCGWSDLGTPHRVGEIVKLLASDSPADRAGHLNLAAQHAHFVSTNAQSDHLRLAR